VPDLPHKQDTGVRRCVEEDTMTGGTVPVPTPETAPFWEGALAGELRIQRCNACGRHYFYPRPFCRFCSSRDVEWRRVSGTGRLVSYIINERPVPPAAPDEPQIIALVELDEGPRMMTNIVGVEPVPENLPLDSRVRVEFEARDTQAIPVFRLENLESRA
jgi:uncharacterized OB-fold protein